MTTHTKKLTTWKRYDTMRWVSLVTHVASNYVKDKMQDFPKVSKWWDVSTKGEQTNEYGIIHQ